MENVDDSYEAFEVPPPSLRPISCKSTTTHECRLLQQALRGRSSRIKKIFTLVGTKSVIASRREGLEVISADE